MESRIEDILSATIGGKSYDKPGESRIENLLIDLKEQIDDKVDKISGKGLSTNDFTTAEKTKLDDLAEIKSIGTGLALDSSTGELIATGGGGGGGTSDYTALINKPQINSVILSGNKSLSDLGITYESESAASDGTTLSLVTTGEKYAWNNKQSAINDLSTIRSGAALGATAVQPETGKGLSTNDYTTAEKTKLAGIAEGAEVNEIEGIKVNNTTINPDANKVVNITVPTTAADVSALPDTTKYATALSLTINASTFVMTGQLKDQNGNDLGTVQTIDLPLESVVVNGSYNSQTKKVVLTLQNGNAIEFSVADLVSGLQTELSASNKLNPAYIDYDSAHAAVTEAQRDQIETNKNNISLLAIKGGGYNFVKIGTNSYTGYGLTLTVANGVVTVSGTATGNLSLYLSGTITDEITADNKLSSQLPTQIAFTGAPDTDTNNRMIFSLYNDSTWVYSGSTKDLYHDLSGKTYNNWLIYISIVSGVTYNGAWKPMIIDKTVYDNGFTDFQPYAMSNSELTNNILSEQQKTTGMTAGGTDYITVNGIRVYVSATQPTGARTGDLWIGG